MSVRKDNRGKSLRWLSGVASLVGGDTLPFMACASKSRLCAVEAGETPVDAVVSVRTANGAGLRLIFNDDHGMMPSVTIVNQTDSPVTLCAVRPSILCTDNGTYDLDVLLACERPTIEPGSPRVIRITDIGRNPGEPLRVGSGRGIALEPCPDGPFFPDGAVVPPCTGGD